MSKKVAAVRLDLPPKDRERLRVVAAMAGMPMAHFARQAVLNAIKTASKGSGAAAN